MRQYDISNWDICKDLDCLLFFAQRLDELLFHNSLDTYKYPALTTRTLALEYCNIYNYVEKGIINEQNLTHIFDEFACSLKNDSIAISILNSSYVAGFLKDAGSKTTKDLRNSMWYIARKLGNHKYFERIVEVLRGAICENREKSVIEAYTKVLVRELIDNGYDENYIFESLHRIFFKEPVKSIDTFNTYINQFDFQSHKYDVYLNYNIDISSLIPAFNVIDGFKVENVDPINAPTGIKLKRTKSILKFNSVVSLDKYSAYETSKSISNFLIDCYGYFKHNSYPIIPYGQVVSENGEIKTINIKDTLKQKVSALSHEESTQNAESLYRLSLSTLNNLAGISKITHLHNSAIQTDNTPDALLGLWSALEILSDIENDDKANVVKVIDLVVPLSKKAYLRKLVSNVMLDIKRWNSDFYSNKIGSITFGENLLEKTFAFLSFESSDSMRDELYSLTDNFPLLRYRVYSLSQKLKDTKNIKAILASHCQRISWHLNRIYRARNFIVHDGGYQDKSFNYLVMNLHTLVDTVFNQIMTTMNESPYVDTLHDALIDQKVSTTIIDNYLEGSQNELTHENNAYMLLNYSI